MRRRIPWGAVLVALLLPLPVAAQDATPEATETALEAGSTKLRLDLGQPGARRLYLRAGESQLGALRRVVEVCDDLAAFDPHAGQLFHQEKLTANDVERARNEAISHAAKRPLLTFKLKTTDVSAADRLLVCAQPFGALSLTLSFQPTPTSMSSRKLACSIYGISGRYQPWSSYHPPGPAGV